MSESNKQLSWVQPHYDPTGLLTLWVNRGNIFRTLLAAVKR